MTLRERKNVEFLMVMLDEEIGRVVNPGIVRSMKASYKMLKRWLDADTKKKQGRVITLAEVREALAIGAEARKAAEKIRRRR